MSWMDAPAERDAWLAVMASLDGSETPEELLTALLEDDGETAPPAVFSRSSSTSSERLVDSSDTQPTAKPKRKKKRAPCRIRSDLEMLRKTVSDLTAYLAVLEARHQARKSDGLATGLRMIAGSTEHESHEVWREVATRQYRWRRESEVENERLRGALDEQQKIVHGLGKLLKRSYTALGNVTPITWHPVEVEGAQYVRRINELMMITTEMYHFASEVLITQPVSSAQTQAPLPVLPIRTKGSLLPQYSVADSSVNGRYVPCPPEAITKGLWDYFCASSQGNSDSYLRERVEATDDCVIKSFQLHWNSGSHFVNHRGIVVARKFSHPSGSDVVLYTAELEPIKMPPTVATLLSEAAVSMGGFRTRGWAVIRPSRTDGTDHDAAMSEVIFKTITNPIEGDMGPCPTAQAIHASRSQLAGLVQLSLSRHHERVQRAIDKVLMAR